MRMLRIEKSAIHGLGCFSDSIILPNTVIVEYTGEWINLRQAVHRNRRNARTRSDYILEVDGNTFIDGSIRGNISRFINHSCRPNCCIRRIGRRAFIVSLTRISVSGLGIRTRLSTANWRDQNSFMPVI